MNEVNKASICLAICLLLCAFMVGYIVNSFRVDDVSLNKNDLNEFPIEWDVTTSEQKGNYTVSMTNVVPERDMIETSIYLKTYHQSVQIFIDGKNIYEYGTDVAVTFGDSVPSAINIVPMKEEYIGKTMTIYLTSAYMKKGKLIPEILIGNEKSIIYKIIMDHGILILQTISMFVIAIALIVFWFSSRKAVYASNSFLYLGLSLLLLSTWVTTNSQVPALIYSNGTVIMYLCYMSFFLIPVPVLLYFEETIGQGYKKPFQLLEFVSIGYFLVAYVLQFLNISNFKQLLSGIHIIAIAVLFLLLYVYFDRKRKGTGGKGYKKRTAYSVVFCLAMFFVDMIRYYLFYGNDVALFTRMGLIVYVLGLVIDMIQDSFDSLALAKEAVIYEKLAFSDKLTGLFNRTAYESAVKEMDEQIKNAGTITGGLTVVCFDLNNLKKINDTQGHSRGDAYIKVFGSMLKKVFREYGGVYRTGGDEFIVLLSDTSEIQAKALIGKLENMITAHNNDFQHQWKGVNLSTAYGIASYRQAIDRCVQDVIERGDQLMYQNKAMVKNKMQEIKNKK